MSAGKIGCAFKVFPLTLERSDSKEEEKNKYHLVVHTHHRLMVMITVCQWRVRNLRGIPKIIIIIQIRSMIIVVFQVSEECWRSPGKCASLAVSQRSEKKMSGVSPKGRDEMRCSGGSDDSDPMGIKIRLSLLR
jgi:hypothetical protein